MNSTNNWLIKKLFYIFWAILLLQHPIVSLAQQDSSFIRNIAALPKIKKLTIPSRNGFIILPIISRSIETSWAFGVATSVTLKHRYADSLSRTSNVQSILLYSLRKQMVAAINGTIYFPHEKYILNGQLSLSSFPDKFWGVGQIASANKEEAYTFKQYYIYAHLQRRIRPNLYIGSLYEFQNVFEINYEKNGLFDQQMVTGRNAYKTSGLGGSLTWDTRNHAFTPGKGLLLQYRMNHFGQYLGSDYSYTSFVLDTRKFFTTFKNQVLALQAFGSFNAGKQVPLRSLSSLGGANSMRGYYNGRFRDKNQIVFQAEYRAPIYGRFGLVAFGSTGEVSPSLSKFSVDNFKFSYGMGARFTLSKKENLNLRIDYGITQNKESGFYIQLGEAF